MSNNNDDSPDLLYLGTCMRYIAYDINDKQLGALGKKIKDRINRLKLDETRIPIEYFETSKKMTAAYRESIICYLLGMPNSCFPCIVSVLEHVLKKKYAMEKGKSGNKMRLVDLIDWSMEFLDDIDEMEYFRKIRNRIHNDKPVNLGHCAEAIHHITLVINEWYAKDKITFKTACPLCGRRIRMTFSEHNAPFIGATLSIKCNNCMYKHEGITLTGPKTLRSSRIKDP